MAKPLKQSVTSKFWSELLDPLVLAEIRDYEPWQELSNMFPNTPKEHLWSTDEPSPRARIAELVRTVGVDKQGVCLPQMIGRTSKQRQKLIEASVRRLLREGLIVDEGDGYRATSLLERIALVARD